MKRYPLNMRTTKAIRDKVETAARASGRSLTHEVERIVESNFDREAWRDEVRGMLAVRENPNNSFWPFFMTARVAI